MTLKSILQDASKKALVMISLFALCVACGEDPTGEPDGPGNGGDKPGDGEQYEDIKVVDGKVRFYLEEQSGAARTFTGIGERNWAISKVVVNGKTYGVEVGEDARPYVDVEALSSAIYNATLTMPGSTRWYGSSPYVDVKLPHSQIYHTASTDIKTFPSYASYTKENGNRLIFNDGFAMVVVKLKGSAKIASVKVESPEGKSVSGISNFMPTKGSFAVTKGFDFAVLNTTSRGSFVELNQDEPQTFCVMIAPGTYSQGLKVTICDADHLAMSHTTESLTLAAGDAHTVEMTYAPDSGLAFYEDFDTFVWGGDVMKGATGFGLSPTADVISVDSGMTLSGYELALNVVEYNNPGSGFIQPNNWNSVSDKSVGESHQMSESYVQSRNIGDMGYMFRVQEHPGYVAIGTATEDRGILYTSPFAGVKTISRANVVIDFALQAGFNGELLLQIIDGGIIEEASLNGTPIALTTEMLSYRFNASKCLLKPEGLVIPSSQTEPQTWNRLELTVNGVTDGSKLYFADNISAKGVHGIYLDKVEVREIEEWGRKDGTLRVLLWNILAGMWCDQHNNYDNFVEWVKKYDPDVCIWCESETIYYDDPSKETITDKSQCYLPNGWGELAARFGHPYAVTGGDRDNYSQTMTSKYPISVVQKITDTDVKKNPISHGAGHFTIDVNGKKLNVVTLHMWPMAYFYGTSTSNTEGDLYREFEMQYIVDNTVNHSNYAGEEYWLMAGDTNAHSPLDAWYYGYNEGDSRLLTHNVVRNQTNLKDTIGDIYTGNCFMETYPTHVRIDFIYVSPKMFERIDNSIVLIDEWCRPRKNGNVRNWYAPADHRPLLVDFDMSN